MAFCIISIAIFMSPTANEIFNKQFIIAPKESITIYPNHYINYTSNSLYIFKLETEYISYIYLVADYTRTNDQNNKLFITNSLKTAHGITIENLALEYNILQLTGTLG